jgi:hypothetical protein
MMLVLGLCAAGCGLAPTRPPTALDARADHFRSEGLVCGAPAPDPVGDGINATQVACHGTASGIPIAVTIDDHPKGWPLVSASVPQAAGRRSAVDIWSAVVLPMPGLELVRVEVAAGLEEWADGGAASFGVRGGLAWVATGENGEWTLGVEPDDIAN